MNIKPTSVGLPVPANPLCANEDLSLTVLVYHISPAEDPDVTITVIIAISQVIDPTTGKGPVLYTLNNSSYMGDISDPLLLSTITQDSTSYPAARNVHDTGSSNTVRIIFINTFAAPHPMHFHGHDFQVLAQGHGTWDGTIINPSNPQRRDVQMVWFGVNAMNPKVGSDYLVIQY